ncbi:hypothetical protein [uncultured Friedmanniella sp.]|uniref:hypothetical protein n=1 Tax=uncultured Friedmanniella sp. TaxID=335381 RepID=UPI0035CC4356
MAVGSQSWSQAWVRTASGPNGFWRRSSPGEHFSTAAMAGPELAEALLALLDRYPGTGTVVDVGAGDGALLAGLAGRDAGLGLVGVDLRPRPPTLPAGVYWIEDCWDVSAPGWTSGGMAELVEGLAGPVLVVATEWLDDLPCPVAVRTPDGHRELRADGRAGAPLRSEDQDWVDRWWPGGELVEVGRSRDLAWAALVRSLDRVGGLTLAVDYGHDRSGRPSQGSLAGFRAGLPVAAWPDRRANLTAAVALDAVAEAGERAGARTVWRRDQADVLAELWPDPGHDHGLAALAARSRRAALVNRRDWGSHGWLLQQVTPSTPVTA